MSAIAPAPFTVVHGGLWPEAWEVVDASGEKIASCHRSHITGHRLDGRDENEEHARLFAASPALLAACERALDAMEHSITGPFRADTMRAIREAIALARPS